MATLLTNPNHALPQVCKIAPGDCQCGDSPFDPVCAFGLTWTDKCDADCGGYSCPQSLGVCTYNANGTFEATPGAAPAGGETSFSRVTDEHIRFSLSRSQVIENL